MSSTTTRAPRTSVRATRPLTRWRTVDLLTVAFLGAAFGIAYWGWGLLYQGPSTALGNLFPPLAAFLYAPWLMAGVVGGLVVRRPGAALLCEVIAAVVEMLPGSQWGFSTLVSGILQGLGAELAFLILGYGSFGVLAAMFAGALAAPVEAIYELYTYYPDWSFGYQVVYVVSFAVGGAVLAGLGGWLITKALARAGALGAFPPGQEERERHAV